jgi:regulatory protein
VPTVTALVPQVGVKGAILLYLDDAFAFATTKGFVREAGLHAGKLLTADETAELEFRASVFQHLQNAYRFLSFRPRTEAEVRGRLRRLRCPAPVADRVVERLIEQRFLDDAAFAQQWAEGRDARAPRSGKLVRWELRQKGIAPDLAVAATAATDDAGAALRAAERRAARLPVLDHAAFRKRLGDFLLRRGFSYDVTNRTVEHLWQQRATTDGEPSDGALDDDF